MTESNLLNSNQSNSGTKEKVKLLSPKKDVVFQVLFGEVGSENITKNFLQDVLNEKITKIDLSKNPILRRMKPTSKMGILDVYAEINGNLPKGFLELLQKLQFNVGTLVVNKVKNFIDKLFGDDENGNK